MLNGLDLFSGIGGLTLALSPWVKPLAYCEIDRYCQAVLLNRMAEGKLPPAPIWDDVRTLEGKQLGPIDIIAGGFPCQDISSAGRAAGLAGERSGLFFEIARLIGELRPSFVFLENVSAIRTRGADIIAGRLAGLGYDCRWDMLSAHDMGAPHERERWWLLANAVRQGSQVPRNVESQEPFGRQRTTSLGCIQAEIWSPAAGELCRISDGIRPQTHRIRALGNSVVPQCAREAFERLMGLKV